MSRIGRQNRGRGGPLIERHESQLDALLAYEPFVRSLARSLVVGDDRVDDVVQDTWVAALERPPRHGSSPVAWLGSVVRYVARGMHRRDLRRLARERRAAQPESLPSAREILEEEQARRALVDAVAALPEHYRDVILLRYFRGQPPRVIARRFGVSVETVKTRLRRGLALLRENLDAQHDERSAWCLPISALAFRDAGKGSLITTFTSILGAGVMATIGVKGVGVATAAAGMIALGLWAFSTDGDSPEPLERSGQAILEPELGEVAEAQAVVVEEAETEDSTIAKAEPVAEPKAQGPVTYTVRGRLVDEEGQPCSGVEVASSQGRGTPTQSDASGEFRWEWQVKAPFQRSFQLDLRCWADHVESVQVAVDIVPEQCDFDLGDIILNPAVTLSGHVVDEAGRPVESALVRVGAATENDSNLIGITMPDELLGGWAYLTAGSLSTVTDGAGRFQIGGVPKRLVWVLLWAMADDTFSACTKPIAIGDLDEVNDLLIEVLRLQPKDYNEGVVLGPEGEVMPEIHFVAREAGGSGRHNVRTDENGRFRDRLRTRTTVDYEVDLRPNAYSRHKAPRIGVLKNVPPGSHDLVLQLHEPKRLRFEAFDPEGKPIEVYYVLGRRLDGSGHPEFSNSHYRKEEGVFEMPLPQEAFHVQITSPGLRSIELGPFDRDDLPEPVNTFRLDFEAKGAFVGRVLRNARPVSGAGVLLLAAFEDDRRFFVAGVPSRFRPVGDPVLTDSEGYFRVPVLTEEMFGSAPDPRSYSLRAQIEGSAPSTLGPLEHREDRDTTGIEIHLTEGGAITGLVSVPETVDRTTLRVLANRGDGIPVTTSFTDEGTYRIDHLEPGQYRVDIIEANSLNYGSISGRTGRSATPNWNCTVVDGGVTTLDLALDDEAVLNGSVLLGHAAPTAWEVVLEVPQPVWRNVSVPLDGSGRFTLEARPTSQMRLVLSGSLPPGGPNFRITQPIELHAGENTWSLDLPTGELEGTVALEPGHPVTVSCTWVDGEREIRCQVRPEPDGSFRLPVAPAGTVELVRNVPGVATSEPFTAVIVEGEVTRVELGR